MTSSEFDPYHKWLGIPPADQPPDYYRLLGIARFESDPDVISNAADQRMVHLRQFQTGPHANMVAKVLSNIAKARRVLLSLTRKAGYDRGLRQLANDQTKPPLPPSISVEQVQYEDPPVPAEIITEVDRSLVREVSPNRSWSIAPTTTRAIMAFPWAILGIAVVCELINLTDVSISNYRSDTQKLIAAAMGTAKFIGGYIVARAIEGVLLAWTQTTSVAPVRPARSAKSDNRPAN